MAPAVQEHHVRSTLWGSWSWLTFRGLGFISELPMVSIDPFAEPFEGPGWSSCFTRDCEPTLPPLRRPEKQEMLRLSAQDIFVTSLSSDGQ